MKKQLAFSILILSTGLAVAQSTEQPSLVPPVVNTITAEELIEITNSINNEITELGSKTQDTINIIQNQIVELDVKTQSSMDKMFDSLMNEIDSLQINTEEDATTFYSETIATLNDLQNKIIELEKALLELEQSQDIAKLNLLFDFDSTTLASDYTEQINFVSQFIKTHTNWKLTIIGYADERGTEKYNYDLGLKRAEAIQTLLIEKGVDASRITIKSFGEVVPANAAKSEEANKENRRITFQLVK